ncbi:hypothetical protein LSH36_32g04000 [Paralvinella palmiformis]|uniref:Chromatin accessibility complex protein 1 n=1 Tax=Paralvinella palmiformis TaxID=53620 RepID=A0AAD9K8X1_9ANNE|nr:hypothetical protein LSH36_32g04000 [Paralvinella palmiformis]
MAESGAEVCLLPVSRIRTIMKSSPEISSISQESLFLIGKATELFVRHMAAETLNNSKSKMFLDYSSLAEVVSDNEQLQFLMDIIPKKIKMRDFKAMMARRKKKHAAENETDDDEEEEEEDEVECSH